MKKLVSLFLACAIALSIGMLPAFATTETELYSGREEILSEGALTGTPGANGDFACTNFTPGDDLIKNGFEEKIGSSVGVQVKKDGDNVYFELNGFNTRYDNYWSHKLFKYDYDNKSNSTKVKKYSALVSVPSTEQGATNVFGQQDGKDGNASVFNVKANKGFGVHLTKGGAYYWDPAAVVDEDTTGAYVNFIPDGTMQADKYYRVEAIMDARGRASMSEVGPLYMRAFVYDGEDLLGETGWVLPTNYSYKYYLTGRITIIEAYGYPQENSAVKVDEFKAYKLENIPTLEVESGSASAIINKYVAAKTANLWFRTVGERFNLATTTKNNLLGDGSANTAARYNLSFRIPEFGSEFHLIDFIAGRNMLNSNTQALEGVAMVDATGAFGAKAVDGTAVALTDGTSYQLAVNTWYTLEALVDYSTFDEPKATITLKDEAGNVLTQSAQPYTIAKIPNSPEKPHYCQASLVWVGFSKTNSYIHFDNTAAYIAPTYADLLANTNITTVIEDDFETYLGDDAQYYVEGYNYNELVGLKPIMPGEDAGPDAKPIPVLKDAIHVIHSDGKVTNTNNAVIAGDKSAEGIDFVDGMTLPATKAMTLNFAFSNDIPNENINYNTVMVYANDSELIPGVDYDLVPAGDGEITGSSKNMSIKLNAAAANTTYKIRLTTGVSDYNMSVTSASDAVLMGIPTKAGAYQDITFTTPDDVKATSIVSKVVNEEGATVESLAKAASVCGKVEIVNADSTSISGCVAIAVYDNGKLVDLKISDGFTVAPNMVSEDTTEAIAITKAGLNAKVFVWDRLDSLQPMALEFALTK